MIYERPNKPMLPSRSPIKRSAFDGRPKAREISVPLVVSDATNCFVTPKDVAERVAQYADVQGFDVLEPSAGTGNLVHAALSAGAQSVCAVERAYELVSHVKKRFHGHNNVTIHHGCFIEYAAECFTFERIIMNPPYSKVIKKHMNAAYKLLAEGGLLVAIVPVTYEHEHMQTLEQLSRDTFSGTSVSTKIIMIEKPN